MDIKVQQEIAGKLLVDIRKWDKGAVLAGGAPRDWFFERPCNDLDFYIKCTSTDLLERVMELDGFDMKRKDPGDDNYKAMPGLQAVYDGEYEGMKFQVMAVNREPSQVITSFSSSICQFLWDGKVIKGSREAIYGLAIGMVSRCRAYEATHPHILKVMGYYQGFEWGGYRSVGFKMLGMGKEIVEKVREAYRNSPQTYNQLLEMVK